MQLIIIPSKLLLFFPCTVKKSGKATSIPGGMVLYFFWSGVESIYMDRAFVCDFPTMMTPWYAPPLIEPLKGYILYIYYI